MFNDGNNMHSNLDMQVLTSKNLTRWAARSTEECSTVMREQMTRTNESSVLDNNLLTRTLVSLVLVIPYTASLKVSIKKTFGSN